MKKFYGILSTCILFCLNTGCQGKKDGFEILCDAPNRAGVGDLAPDQKAVALAKWIDENLKCEEAREVFEKLALLPSDQKAKFLRDSAKKVGLANCPLADLFDASAKPLPLDNQPPEKAPDSP